MNKLFLLIGLVVLVSGSVFGETTQWKETYTPLTKLLENKDYEIVAVTKSESYYVYHIRGPKEFIMCVTHMSGWAIPLSTTCYYEDY